MKLSCEIVRDILPLYIDGICSKESAESVEAHLKDCEGCRSCFERMTTLEHTDKADFQGEKMADGLKKLRKRMNKKVRNGIIATLTLVCALFAGYQALFNLSLKPLGPEDVRFDVKRYAVNELPMLRVDTDEDSVEIRKGEADDSALLQIEIPEMPNSEIHITENVLKETGTISVISLTSRYHIREMRWREGDEQGTIYITALKTTIFNNAAGEGQQTSRSIDMRDIRKIVYVYSDSRETVLWQESEGDFAE